jgi:hypothetical protein
MSRLTIDADNNITAHTVSSPKLVYPVSEKYLRAEANMFSSPYNRRKRLDDTKPIGLPCAF